MNQRERELLGRVYDVVNRMSGLRARNPADIKTISRYHNEVPKIMQPLNMALSCLGYGDLRDCGECLDEAERELEEALRD